MSFYLSDQWLRVLLHRRGKNRGEIASCHDSPKFYSRTRQSGSMQRNYRSTYRWDFVLFPLQFWQYFTQNTCNETRLHIIKFSPRHFGNYGNVNYHLSFFNISKYRHLISGITKCQLFSFDLNHVPFLSGFLLLLTRTVFL